MTKGSIYILVTLLLFLVFSSGYLFSFYYLIQKDSFKHKHLDDQREEFITHKDRMIEEMIRNRQYKCCLVKPCTYCIEKTPGHGKGATCHCLKDVVEGKHPCGECIGEILEGHGNPLLAKYFASAIAEEVGKKHLDTLKTIVFDKYNYPYEKQQ